MKQLVMKVNRFFNVKHKDGTTLTILGGSLNCDLQNEEIVEIHTINEVLKTNIVEIKCHKDTLEKASSGLSCGIGFSGISYMQFRVTEPIINPYDPKTELIKFLDFETKEHDAEGVYIFREVPDETFAEKRSERDSEGDNPKPNFLFLHGS